MKRLGGMRGRQTKAVPRRRLSDETRRTSDAPATGSSRQVFRRNQTLTGTTSRDVRPATELSGQMQSPRATVHHLRQKRRKLSGYLVGGLFGLLLFAVMLQQFTAEVRVSVVGQVQPLTKAQHQRLVEPIESYLAARPFERFRVLLNHSNIVSHYQSEGVREVASISSVNQNGWGGALVSLQVREPVARWMVGGEELFVDKNGAVFAVNHFDISTVAIRDESGITSRTEAEAQAVTSSRFLEFVGRSVGLLSQYNLQVESVVIPAGTTRQIEVLLAGSRSVPIKMTIDRPVGEQAEDARRAYHYLSQRGRQLPEYIDVRASGTAYYR